MSSVIFNGNFVKALRDQLKLNNTCRIITGTTDPTVVAADAEQGSIYLRVGGAGGTIYNKQDNGLTTNWTLGSPFDVNTILVNANGDVLTNGVNVLVA